MAIETVHQVVTLGMSADETMARLVQWCEHQGLTFSRPGPGQLECRIGEKSAGALGSLMLGSFSNMEKWPVKVLVQIQTDQGTPGAAAPTQAPAQSLAMKPKFCFNCGSALPDEGRFCPGCGSPVAAGEEATGPATSVSQGSVQVTISASHDIPASMLMGQMALGPFKEKYEQRLAQIILRIQQAWGQVGVSSV